MAVISQWRKEAMRSTLKAVKKMAVDAVKASKAKLTQKVCTNSSKVYHYIASHC